MALKFKKWPILVSLVAGLALLPLLAVTPKVSAAAAVCLWNATDHPTSTVSCSSQLGSLKTAGISAAAANTCYYIQEASPSGGFVGVPTVISAPIGSTQCNSWQASAKTVSATKPICLKVAGKVEAYRNNTISPDMLTKVACNSSLLSGQPSGSNTTQFQNGACYLVFSNKAIITGDSCTDIIQEAASAQTAQDNQPSGSGSVALNGPEPAGDVCGGGDNAVTISLKIGCQHKGNPIVDMLFAIIRFLSLGVGIVVVGSIVVAGIQYTSSRGDPQAVKAAQGRITSTVIALLIYIFTFAILNWILPAGLLK
ncbi:MAG: hypothetical protein ABI221_03660 [Candidatus Saccharimonadales bacterium]